MTIKKSELKQIITEMLREELKVTKLHESVDWAPLDSSKTVTVHCTDGDLIVSTTGYTYI